MTTIALPPDENDRPLIDLFAEEDLPVGTISKTRYMAGRQSLRRLWLEVNHPELRDPTPPEIEAIQKMGHEVGTLALQCWPEGEMVRLDPSNPTPAVLRTRELMADPRVTAIFEATIMCEGLQASCDVLERAPDGGWRIVEVKSSSKDKDEYFDDMAMQYHVFTSAGIDVRGVDLMQPDKGYVRARGEVDAKKYFTRKDVTERILELQAETEVQIARQRAVLASKTEPVEEPGRQCHSPRPCPFLSHCRRVYDNARYPVADLYRANHARVADLWRRNILDIRHIPDDEKITPMQARQREVLRTGVPYHDHEAIERALENIKFPINFLDFETIQPAVPLWKGTAAQEILPVQFSNHTLLANGRMYHKDFLHATEGDPRTKFLRSLVKAVKTEGSIFVYSSYEAARLRAIAKHEDYAEWAPVIESIIARFVDLLPVIQEHTYYPQYAGSFSIKAVLPVFAPDLSYKQLQIQNGSQAASAFLEMVHPDTAPARRMEINMALRKYCQTDTEAMVRLFFRLAPRVVERHLSPKAATRVLGAG